MPIGEAPPQVKSMKPCPECNSRNVYQYSRPVWATGGYGPNLLPGMGSLFMARAKFVPVMCADCGLVRYFATSEARDHVRKSSAWKQV
jgi:predicted nucleic-acid-binding Zn-ribbon protein